MRIVLASLLVLGALALAVLSEPGAFLIALLVLVAVFLLGGARLALDLIELSPVELAADVALLVGVGVALTQIPLGNTLLTEALLVAGLAAQALPRVAIAIRK